MQDASHPSTDGPSLPPLDAIDLTDLDRFQLGFPHDAFTVLRSIAPVWWHRPTEHTPDGVGFWVLSRHADVSAAAADAMTLSSVSAPGQVGGGTLIQDLPVGTAAGVLLNMTDDPLHHRIRRLATPAVSPKALARMEEQLRSLARDLLRSAADAMGEAMDSVDLLRTVAMELPVQATLQILGVPVEDRFRLVEWTNATLGHEDRALGEETDASRSAAGSMSAYAMELIEQKRKHPADDMMSAVVHARVERGDGSTEHLSTLELMMFFSLLVAAGSETTRNAIALGVAALIEHPDQLALLRTHDELLATATEEILRWSSPTLYNRRTACDDIDLYGQRIRSGDKVTLWWASANFDDRVFPDPFRFDIRRQPNPHLAFGYRTHFCLGAALARMEIKVFLQELLSGYETFRFAGPLQRVRTNKHAGIAAMPVSFRRRDARSG